MNDKLKIVSLKNMFLLILSESRGDSSNEEFCKDHFMTGEMWYWILAFW